jgi:AbrB family looped-hinge helix DNA binding protein
MFQLPYDIYASVTERGQVTIPAEVRKALGLSKPGKVIFRVENGVVVLKKPRFSSVSEIAGSVPPLKEPKTWEEIKLIAHEDVAREVMESMQREVEDHYG